MRAQLARLRRAKRVQARGDVHAAAAEHRAAEQTRPQRVERARLLGGGQGARHRRDQHGAGQLGIGVQDQLGVARWEG